MQALDRIPSKEHFLDDGSSHHRDESGHIQRGGSPCAFDRELATRFGVKAVELLAEGKFGHVAAMENGHVVAKPIEKAIKKLKLVDPAGELVRTARAVGIELGA